MAISLTDLSYDSAQNPVGVDKNFTLTLSLFAPPGDGSTTGTVRLWTPAAYAVVPASVDVALPAGQTSGNKTVPIQLHGTAQKELVRIYAECDERHSVFVQVK
jgi:hypothetical protein